MSLGIEVEQEETRDETNQQSLLANELRAELEKQQGIEEYIANHLPESEQRIEEPQAKDCKVSVVIPAYAEGAGVLRPLASLAKQEGIRPEEFETIIVVNQASQLPPRALSESEADYARKQALFEQAGQENEQTLALISALQSGVIPENLDDEQKAACQKIIDSGIRVYAVDKASSGSAFTPDQANVGSARDRGMAEAVERFFARRVDGIIAQSDADVAFDSNYLATLVRTFEEDPDLVGVAGKAEFDKLPEVEAALPEIANGAAEVYQAVWNRLLFNELGTKPDEADTKEDIHFFGCGMSSRAYASAKADGVSHIAGGEDTVFGSALQGQGKVINQPDAVVHPLARFSARTEVGAGHGQRLLAAAESYANGGLMVPNPDSIAAYVDVRKTLASHLGEEAGTMPILTSEEASLVSDEAMVRLRAIAAKSSTIDEVLGDPSLKDVRDGIQARLDEIYQPTPISEAVQRIAELVVNNDEQRRQDYEAQVQRLLSSEDEPEDEGELLQAAIRLSVLNTI